MMRTSVRFCHVGRPVITYGFNEDNDIRAIDVEQDGMRSHFTVLRKDVSRYV